MKNVSLEYLSIFWNFDSFEYLLLDGVLKSWPRVLTSYTDGEKDYFIEINTPYVLKYLIKSLFWQK